MHNLRCRPEALDRLTHALLTVAQMAEADRRTIASGISGPALMEAAGAAVVDAIRQRWTPQPTLVLCGPGNNGGDGFVIARLLAAAGWPVRLAVLGSRSAIRGDAAFHAALWQGAVESIQDADVVTVSLVVDALFGAGLSRPLDGAAAAILAAVAARGIPVVAVDTPSGVHGDTGANWGAIEAALTVTFARAKPGHILLPGRKLCGELVVAPIGISDETIAALAPLTSRNGPALWCPVFPRPGAEAHKYARGHALIFGGWPTSGAARLGARAALRTGAGLVSVAVPPEGFAVYAGALEAVMVKPVASDEDLAGLLSDIRHNALLIGPGAGLGPVTLERTLTIIRADRATILDADALTALSEAPDRFHDALAARTCGLPIILTPHEGEFRRLFPAKADKLTRVRDAALSTGAIIVLKGADTVIAAPDGRAVINDNAPPTLATAGSGDVLAGIILGLIAQGMPGFEAASAGVWLHGAAAGGFGPGLIAEDLPDALPWVLRGLL